MKLQPTMSAQFKLRLRRFSPILCRLLARERYGRPLSTDTIAKRAGVSVPIAAMMSEQTDWHGVDIYHTLAFMRACGVDILDSQQMRRVEGYLRRRPSFLYLRNSGDWETTYKPLMAKWLKANKV